MKPNRLFLVAAAALLGAPAFAQSDAQCIVAGRLSDGLWAPKFVGQHLFGAQGQPISTPTRQALSGVRRVNLDQSALLSRCDGDQPLANGDSEGPGRKTPVPAVAAGDVDVEGVS